MKTLLLLFCVNMGRLNRDDCLPRPFANGNPEKPSYYFIKLSDYYNCEINATQSIILSEKGICGELYQDHKQRNTLAREQCNEL